MSSVRSNETPEEEDFLWTCYAMENIILADPTVGSSKIMILQNISAKIHLSQFFSYCKILIENVSVTENAAEL